jgi:hypothetical protein
MSTAAEQSDPDVKEVNLSSAGIFDLPKDIISLRRLEVLNLGGNNLSTIPDDIVLLSELRVLFFAGNRFETIPSCLGKMNSLYMLSFKSNRIKTVPDDSLSPSLGWLILTDNQITQLPRSIGHLSGLRKLLLANNQLSSLPEELSLCQELELIRLSSNLLSEIPEWIFRLPRLSWLAIARNPACPPIIEASSNRPTIPNDCISLQGIIGEGASGVIYRAEVSSSYTPLHQQAPVFSSDSPSLCVAIKFFKGANTSDGCPEDERNITLTLPPHASLVPVYGTVTTPLSEQLGLVFPLIPSHYQPLAGPPSFRSVTRDVYRTDQIFSLSQVLRILRDLSECCALLHAHNLMHGDLYGHNILISDRQPNGLPSAYDCPVLVDFGAASLLPSYRTLTNTHTPDLIDTQSISELNNSGLVDKQCGSFEAIEMLAFGHLMGELLDRCPFYHPTTTDTTDTPTTEDMPLQLRLILDHLTIIHRECEGGVPSKRPSFANVAQRLAENLDSYETHLMSNLH